jgi:MFS family permease
MRSMSLTPPAAATLLPARRAFLTARTAFVLQASLIVSFLAGSIAPTPLYAVYQSAWGFSPITITVVFGIYAIAVLSALLTVGALSDHIGRRPVLFVATIAQGLSMVLFATAGGVSALMVGRIVQGLATGAAMGALGAGLLDIDRQKGTIANAVSPMTGTATGGLVSGLMIQYLPAPTHLVYLVLLGVFMAQAVGVALMAETATRRPGALASLRPHIRVPATLRRPMLLAIPALVATWALAGFYGALGPTLVRRILQSRSLALGGLAVFVLAGSGALTTFVVRSRPARAVMALGAVALLVGVGLTLVAIDLGSAAVFFAGATLAGIGFGAGFQGAIRMVVPLAGPQERAGVLSALYVVCYLAMGVPAVLGGLRVVYGHGLLSAAREYGVAVMVLALLALAGSAWERLGARGADAS